DTVFDERGRPTGVVAVSGAMHGRPCHEVTVSDGCRIVADAEHEWPVHGPGPSVRTAAELAAAVAAGPVPGASARGRRITSVEPVASVPVRCIQVDSPSHLYLAGASMVPTHNSTMLSAVCLYALLADGEAAPEVYIAAADREQAKIVYDE